MDALLTLAEASEVLDPPLTVKQLREIVRALGWKPAGNRYSGRAGHPHATYSAEKIMKMHRALVDAGSIELFFGQATHPRTRADDG